MNEAERDNSKSHWRKILYGIRARTRNPKHVSYSRYGGKGIKCFLSNEDIRKLWLRDNAGEMSKPSIDRLDSNKDYTYKNCRFMELSENSRIGVTKYHSKRSNLDYCKNGHQFVESNTYWTGPRKSYRECRTCKRERGKKKRLIKRGLGKDSSEQLRL